MLQLPGLHVESNAAGLLWPLQYPSLLRQANHLYPYNRFGQTGTMEAANISWDTDKIKCLIEDYRERRPLWDLRDPHYKDKKQKLSLWEELSSKYEISVRDLKEKLKNLRTTFHRNRRKKSGTWPHMDSLSFILEVDDPQQSTYTEDNFSQSEPEGDEILYNSSLTWEPIPPNQENRFVVPSAKKRKIAKTRSTTLVEDEDGRIEEAYELFRKASRQDEFSTYGQHVGMELRKLSATSYQVAKYHINNILFNAAMGRFEATSLPTPSRSSQHSPSPVSQHSFSPSHSPTQLHPLIILDEPSTSSSGPRKQNVSK